MQVLGIINNAFGLAELRERDRRLGSVSHSDEEKKYNRKW